MVSIVKKLFKHNKKIYTVLIFCYFSSLPLPLIQKNTVSSIKEEIIERVASGSYSEKAARALKFRELTVRELTVDN